MPVTIAILFCQQSISWFLCDHCNHQQLHQLHLRRQLWLRLFITLNAIIQIHHYLLEVRWLPLLSIAGATINVAVDGIFINYYWRFNIYYYISLYNRGLFYLIFIIIITVVEFITFACCLAFDISREHPYYPQYLIAVCC